MKIKLSLGTVSTNKFWSEQQMLCSVSAFNRSLILMVKIQLFIKMTLHSSELFLWMQCKLGWSPDPLAQSPQAACTGADPW